MVRTYCNTTGHNSLVEVFKESGPTKSRANDMKTRDKHGTLVTVTGGATARGATATTTASGPRRCMCGQLLLNFKLLD